MGNSSIETQLKLFEKSLTKQAKWNAINRLLDPATINCGLDLGADNGIISYLLRQLGGDWHSADLTEHTVTSIRSLVGKNVYRIDGRTLPFADEKFDIVVVIDMLEHVDDEQALIGEIDRVLRPGGRVIVNVPHIKRFSLLRRLRIRWGLTDAWHGHLRPGYTLPALKILLRPCFEIRRHRTYNKFFSELLDIVLNGLYIRKIGAENTRSAKGSLVTTETIARHEKSFRLLSALYPLMWLFTRFDLLAWPFQGYSLIIAADKKTRGRGG